jgi:hypothetical protein
VRKITSDSKENHAVAFVLQRRYRTSQKEEEGIQMKSVDRRFARFTALRVLVLIPFSTVAAALAQVQTLTVRGTVGTSTIPARYVSVTFIDRSDAAKKVTVVTDTTGRQ